MDPRVLPRLPTKSFTDYDSIFEDGKNRENYFLDFQTITTSDITTSDVIWPQCVGMEVIRAMYVGLNAKDSNNIQIIGILILLVLHLL